VEVTTRAVRTNNPVAGALRGFGATQVCFAMESTVDTLAAELGLDRVEIRRRNLLNPGDRLATSGQRLEGTAAPAELLEAVVAAPLPAGPPPPGHRRGTGIALGVKSAGLGDGRPDGAGVVLRLGRAGLEIASSAAEVGQGVVAVLAQIAREHLGPVAVRLAAASTDLPVSGGSKASRQTMASGGAVDLAARKLRGELDDLAARRGLGGWDDDLARDPGRLLGGGELVADEWYATPPTQAADPDTGRGDLHIAFQLTAHRAIVDVDPELGTTVVTQLVAAQDVGRAVNPALVRGQLTGGAVQGAGFALLEEIPVDDQGRGGATGFDTYLLPTTLDAPEVIPIILESSPHPGWSGDGGGGVGLAFGVKGVGEGPLISSPAAVAAALRDASGRAVARIPAHPADLVALSGRGGADGVGEV
jgi:CO/xanthine dehydrogenase Mo-binding subunit